MRPAFPLLIANALAWAGTKADAATTRRPRCDRRQRCACATTCRRSRSRTPASTRSATWSWPPTWATRASPTRRPSTRAGAGRAHAGAARSARLARPAVRGRRAGAVAGARAAAVRMGQLPPQVDDVRPRSVLRRSARWRSSARRGCCCRCWRRRCVLAVRAALARRFSARRSWRAGVAADAGAGGRGRRAGRTDACAARRARSRPSRWSTSPTACPTARSRSRDQAVPSLAPRRRRTRRSAAARRPLRRARRGDRPATPGGRHRAPARRPPAPPPTWRWPSTSAPGLVDATAIPRLLLLSDGVPTRGDCSRPPSGCATAALPLYALAAAARTRAATSRSSSSPPPTTCARARRSGSTSGCSADRAGEARVRLDGAGDAHVAIDEPEQTLALGAAATATASFTVRINEPGTSDAAGAAATAAGGDRHPGNDEGVLAIATEQRRRACFASKGRRRACASFARALAAEHIAADVRPARSLARDADFGRYDLVVLADVPRAVLPDTTLAALDGFVRAGRRPAGRGRDAELRPRRLHRHAPRIDAARAARHPRQARGGDAGAGAGHRPIRVDVGPQDGADQGGGARHRRDAARRST